MRRRKYRRYLVSWHNEFGESGQALAGNMGCAVRRAQEYDRPGCWAAVLDAYERDAPYAVVREYGTRFAALQAVAQRSAPSQDVSLERKPMGHAEAQAGLRAEEATH